MLFLNSKSIPTCTQVSKERGRLTVKVSIYLKVAIHIQVNTGKGVGMAQAFIHTRMGIGSLASGVRERRMGSVDMSLRLVPALRAIMLMKRGRVSESTATSLARSMKACTVTTKCMAKVNWFAAMALNLKAIFRMVLKIMEFYSASTVINMKVHSTKINLKATVQ